MKPREWRKKVAELAATYRRDVVSTKTHLRLVCQRGERPFVTASSSSTDPRALLNLERDLKHNDAPLAHRS